MPCRDVRTEKYQTDRCEIKNNNTIKGHCPKIRKERKRSHRRPVFSYPPINGKMIFGRVSSGILRMRWVKASLAVETVLVLPLFFMGLITMISFMDIYRLETEKLTDLCGAARQAGMYAYSAGNETDDITIPGMCVYEPVGGLIPLPKVYTFQKVTVRAWTGKDFEEFQDDVQLEKMVYLTESGSVFHRSLGCSYLNVSVSRVAGSTISSAKNKYGETYSACEICSRGQAPAGSVYITKQGNRYHNQENCSGLKRSVRMVKESEAEGMPACSRCG